MCDQAEPKICIASTNWRPPLAAIASNAGRATLSEISYGQMRSIGRSTTPIALYLESSKLSSIWRSRG